jgi:hypothetical protein
MATSHDDLPRYAIHDDPPIYTEDYTTPTYPTTGHQYLEANMLNTLSAIRDPPPAYIELHNYVEIDLNIPYPEPQRTGYHQTNTVSDARKDTIRKTCRRCFACCLLVCVIVVIFVVPNLTVWISERSNG